MTFSDAAPGASAPPDDLARAALSLYGQQGARLTLLRQGDNTVYRVDTAAHERFALRLHTAARLQERALTSELTWLDHLSRVARLPVPPSVRAATGAWVARVGGQEHSPWCSALSWLDGESLAEDEGFTAAQAREAGALVARLHVEAERFAAPPEFERPRYDAPYFMACWDDLAGSVAGQVSDARLGDVRARLRVLASASRRVNAVPGGFGLVHADTHPGNFVRREAGLGLLDFDRCGWGPFLLDVAHATLGMGSSERQAFVDGYLGIRALPAAFERTLKVLSIFAAVENLAFLARRPHELPFVLGALPAVEEMLAR